MCGRRGSGIATRNTAAGAQFQVDRTRVTPVTQDCGVSGPPPRALAVRARVSAGPPQNSEPCGCGLTSPPAPPLAAFVRAQGAAGVRGGVRCRKRSAYLRRAHGAPASSSIVRRSSAGRYAPVGVQLLVALHQVRAVLAQPVQEDLPHRSAQEQRLAADVHGARLGRQRHDPLHLLGRVVDARHQRRDQDPGRDPVPVQLGHRLQPRARVRRVRLRRPPRLLVQRRHRQARANSRALGDLAQQVHVAQHQRRLRQDRARIRKSRIASQIPRISL